MHTTTVRFSAETWAELREVCARDGIAAAAFIREATIARLAQSAILPREERQDEALGELRARVERIERILTRAGRRVP